MSTDGTTTGHCWIGSWPSDVTHLRDLSETYEPEHIYIADDMRLDPVTIELPAPRARVVRGAVVWATEPHDENGSSDE